MYKKELTDINTINKFETEICVSGTTFATELMAVIPNALAEPFQRYHEIEVKKNLLISAMDHQTSERADICKVIVELAKLGELNSEKFQMLMVAYGMKRL